MRIGRTSLNFDYYSQFHLLLTIYYLLSSR